MATYGGDFSANVSRENPSGAAAPDDRVDVSIVICTRDRCLHLRQGLAQLGTVAIPDGWRVELVVVDNGSSDETSAVVRAASLADMPVRYVFEPAKGKGHAYNSGLAAARGSVLLLTDDDTRPPPNWIEEMCRPILDGQVDAVQGGVRIAPHLDRPWLRGVLRTWVAEVVDPEIPPEGLVGANMAFSRNAMLEVGPFDPSLGPGAAGFFDDTVYGWRLRATGRKVLYLPSVAVEHHFDADRLSLKAFLSSARRMAHSRALVAWQLEPGYRRPRWLELGQRLPPLVFHAFMQGVRYWPGRRPDSGFLYQYYRFCLWRALRIASPRAVQEPAGNS